jgi:hypothetical protein
MNPRYLPALQSMGRILHGAAHWTELVDMYRRESRSVEGQLDSRAAVR